MNISPKKFEPAEALSRRLRLMGPIAIAEYMRLSMLGGEHSYYVSAAPIGAAGDFITAPEISQMFGELIGLWCVDAWQRLGRPDPFLLVEFGPGKGTLMSDLLRAAAIDPAFLAAARLNLIEINEPLRSAQRLVLTDHSPIWHRDLTSLPDGPAIILGNEFLDVFPIHQFQMTEKGWRERAVEMAQDDFSWTLIPPGPQLGLLRPAHRKARPGDIAEVCPAALAFIGDVSRRLKTAGGTALFIDYGPTESRLGQSLQAVKGHWSVNPLSQFAAADLSAHVDFAALGAVATEIGASVQGPVTQGSFLKSLGIEARARRLCEAADAKSRRDVEAALERLTAPQAMGSLFKVMALRGPEAPELAGFT